MTGLNQGNPGLLDFTQSTILYLKISLVFHVMGLYHDYFSIWFQLKKHNFLGVYWIFIGYLLLPKQYLLIHTHKQLRSSIHYTTTDFIIVKQSGGKLFVILSWCLQMTRQCFCAVSRAQLILWFIFDCLAGNNRGWGWDR